MGVEDSVGTPFSSKYPRYWPRTAWRAASSGSHRRIALSTSTFLSRSDSASMALGGSIATMVSNWSRWFCTISRTTPDWS